MSTRYEPTVGSAVGCVLFFAIAGLLWHEVYSPWFAQIAARPMALGATTVATLYTAVVAHNFYHMRLRLAQQKG